MVPSSPQKTKKKKKAPEEEPVEELVEISISTLKRLLVTEGEVDDALEQVGLNKSPGLDGLLYEIYLRMLRKSVSILTDAFHHQRVIPTSIIRGVITWNERPIRILRVWFGPGL